MIFYKLIFLSVACVTTVASPVVNKYQVHCPEIEGCSSCNMISAFTYSIDCRLNGIDHFTFSCTPLIKHMAINCNGGTDLDNVHIQNKTFAQFIDKIQIDNCHFRNSSTIINFIQKLGIERIKIEEITLTNPRFLSPVTKEYFDNLPNIVSLTVKIVNHEVDQIPDTMLIQPKPLEKNTFADMKESLELIGNVFQGLDNLNYLYLQRLGLQHLHHNLFINTRNLDTLDLSHNGLRTLENRLFNQLKNLTKLYLSHNNIDSLNEETFADLKQLKQLDLSRNNFTRISSKIFDSLRELNQLCLSHNRISTIDHDAFMHLRNLKVLDLSQNALTTLNLFKSADSRFSVFHYCKSMVELILHNNKITNIYSDWLDFEHLRVLDLQRNRITEITSKNLAFKSIDVYLNLIHNHIKNIVIDPEFLSYVMINNPGMINILADFSFNPIYCDCKLYNFMRYFENNLNPDIKSVFHFVASHLECTKPNYLKGEYISNIQSKSLVCVVENNCTKDGCMYFWSPEFKAYLKDCSITNHYEIQSHLRMKELEKSLLNNYSKYFLTELPKC